MDFDDYTIEPDLNGGFAVYGHGIYPESSVLAGQSRRSFLAAYDTVEEAVAAWPEASVMEYSTRVYRGETLEEISGLPACPPDWFDPAAAGETW